MKSLPRPLPAALAISAIAYAIALGAAAWFFDRFVVEPAWLVAAVAIFMLLSVALRRLLNVLDRNDRSYTLLGGLALTYIELLATDALVPGRGFDIDGIGTWIGVTALVWAAGAAFGEMDSTAPDGAPGVSP